MPLPLDPAPTSDELFAAATNFGENYADLVTTATNETRDLGRADQRALEWVQHANLAARTFKRLCPSTDHPNAGTILDLAHALRSYYLAHVLESRVP
jgi:hypothetical protein